jgi:predicted RNase H-like HicB family nuclease
MKHLIVHEKSATGWGAYAPDLPGLGAAGKTLDEVKDLIREAVSFTWKACAHTAIPFLRPAR